MTNERAKSELEQLYMSLSEEKKKALDVAFKAMEQADNIPVMYYPQVDGITPTVVAQADGEKTCGTCRNEDTYHCAECENKSDYEQAQADGDLISRQAVNTLIDELARAISDERCCMSRGRSTATIMRDILHLSPVKPQESSITWVTGADGAKIAFWDVPVWKVTKICEILGEPQESEDKE